MTRIENNAQYEWAVQRVEYLLPLVNDNTPLDDPNSIELALLSNLVADYSDIHYAIGAPSLSEVLKLRMYELCLTQTELAKKLNISPARLSEYISGKREPTLQVARTLVRNLAISPNVVLGL